MCLLISLKNTITMSFTAILYIFNYYDLIFSICSIKHNTFYILRGLKEFYSYVEKITKKTKAN